MTPTIRTTGCTRPWVVQEGYRHTLRIPGPLYREPEPNRLTAPLLLVIGFLSLVIVAGNLIGG